MNTIWNALKICSIRSKNVINKTFLYSCLEKQKALHDFNNYKIIKKLDMDYGDKTKSK